MRLGILGGTFDPIHNAHLFIAEEAASRLKLDRVLILPAGIPPHKRNRTSAESVHRLRMAELAANGNPRFAVCSLEVERSGPSYTSDTLRTLHQQTPGLEILFITGMDTVAEIAAWHEPSEVLRLCTLVGITRPGFDAAAALAALPREAEGRIVPLEAPGMGISSTLIRERIRAGLPVRYLTPDPVVSYIEAHGLYRRQE